MKTRWFILFLITCAACSPIPRVTLSPFGEHVDVKTGQNKVLHGELISIQQGHAYLLSDSLYEILEGNLQSMNVLRDRNLSWILPVLLLSPFNLLFVAS